MQHTITIDTDIEITKEEEYEILESIYNNLTTNPNRKHVYAWFVNDEIPS